MTDMAMGRKRKTPAIAGVFFYFVSTCVKPKSNNNSKGAG
jgi:hypothetical protein